MVFQQFGLLPWRTVEENVGLGLELAGMPDAERKERVARQLKLVNLDQWAKKYAHELSGGMQQRVGLARAFATEAPILLMDEPFSALDPLIRTKLQDELLQLQATLKKTIIFVSHDLEEALKIGSHITIMEGGRIVQTGAPEDIVLQARQRLRPRLHRQREPAVGADRLERHARPPRPRSRPATVGSGSTAARRRASRSTPTGWSPPPSATASRPSGCPATRSRSCRTTPRTCSGRGRAPR